MIKLETDFTAAILFAFLILWMQSGWYRIDCAIGIEKACELVKAEKEYNP